MEKEMEKTDLAADLAAFEKEEAIYNIPIDLIDPNPKQPRKWFKRETLEAMAETLRKNKRVEEEIMVAPRGKRFMIVNGERRWRASKMAGLTHVLAKVRDLNDNEAYIKSGLANFCHDEMTFVEKAIFLRDAMAEFGWTQSEAAENVGLTPGYVSNILKVLRFHEKILNRMLTGELEPGLFLSIASYDKQHQLALSEPLEKAVKARKVTMPNQAHRFVLKTAEKLGLRPVTYSKKSRPQLSYSEVVARAMKRTIQALDSEMDEFHKLSRQDLTALENPSAIVIISLLEQLQESIEREVRSLKEKLPSRTATAIQGRRLSLVS